MPGRKAKPPRLWFREDEGFWVILDRSEGKRRQIRTGCSRDDVDGAAKALETYIGGRHTTTIGATDPGVLAIADVLTSCEISKRPKDKNDRRAWAQHDLLFIRLLDLNCFFGDKTVSKLKACAATSWTGPPARRMKTTGRPRLSHVKAEFPIKPPGAGLRICVLPSTRTMRSVRRASFLRLPYLPRRKAATVG